MRRNDKAFLGRQHDPDNLTSSSPASQHEAAQLSHRSWSLIHEVTNDLTIPVYPKSWQTHMKPHGFDGNGGAGSGATASVRRLRSTENLQPTVMDTDQESQATGHSVFPDYTDARTSKGQEKRDKQRSTRVRCRPPPSFSRHNGKQPADEKRQDGVQGSVNEQKTYPEDARKQRDRRNRRRRNEDGDGGQEDSDSGLESDSDMNTTIKVNGTCVVTISDAYATQLSVTAQRGNVKVACPRIRRDDKERLATRFDRESVKPEKLAEGHKVLDLVYLHRTFIYC